jgi:hypothetical protein
MMMKDLKDVEKAIINLDLIKDDIEQTIENFYNNVFDIINYDDMNYDIEKAIDKSEKYNAYHEYTLNYLKSNIDCDNDVANDTDYFIYKIGLDFLVNRKFGKVVD